MTAVGRGIGVHEYASLQFGAFTDSTHITLTFDEPMADIAGVNPGKFRPSLAWWDSDDSIQVYLDLLNDFPDDNCPCITVSDVENDPADEYSLILTLSAPTTAVTCNNIAYNYLPVMHYDADTLATAQHVRDLADNELVEAEGYFPENPDLSSWDPPADAPFPGFPGGVAVMLGYDQICP